MSVTNYTISLKDRMSLFLRTVKILTRPLSYWRCFECRLPEGHCQCEHTGPLERVDFRGYVLERRDRARIE